MPLVIGLVLALTLTYLQHAEGATAPSSAPAGAKADGVQRKRCIPPGNPDLTCDQWAHRWASNHAEAFKDGKLGNAKGYRLPAVWRKAFNTYFAHHRAARQRLAKKRGDWWKFPLEAMMCTPIAGAGYKVNCDAAARHNKEFSEGLMKIEVVCGGTAAVGALAGGGAAGAGKGALGCLWGMVAIKAFELDIDLDWRVAAQRAVAKQSAILSGTEPLW
ncbi:hypothetical protein [Nocardioides conyzicola]|uniref:hypothetical protein n=1 Tax=Nocardioides conyzicola TaxID=1651781 RepID=UPI0031EE3A66